MKLDKRSLPMGAGAPHYPSKEEGKVLRRMMARAGVPKDELLAEKHHRQELAITLKNAQVSTWEARVVRAQHTAKRIKRRIARELGLPTYDPAVLAKFNAEYEINGCEVHRRGGWRSVRY